MVRRRKFGAPAYGRRRDDGATLIADSPRRLVITLPVTHTLELVARVLLVCMFPFSTLDKLLHWKGAMAQAASSFLPFPAALLVMAMVVEVTTPICIVSGWNAPLAAMVLAAYCVATALLYHRFWRYADFWKLGASVGRDNFWDFTKNLCVAGGLLLVAMGAGFSGSVR